jgi:hypothetical protein
LKIHKPAAAQPSFYQFIAFLEVTFSLRVTGDIFTALQQGFQTSVNRYSWRPNDLQAAPAPFATADKPF